MVLVDGLSQARAAELKKHFGAAGPRENDWHSDSVFDLAWGYYDAKWVGYEHYGGWANRFGAKEAVSLATHRRDICFVKNSYWVISDRLEAQGEHTYSQLFHFEPDRTVKTFGPGRAGTADAKRANVVLVQADAVPAQVIKGRDDPPQGWC